jgi:hypothetical protein
MCCTVDNTYSHVLSFLVEKGNKMKLFESLQIYVSRRIKNYRGGMLRKEMETHTFSQTRQN